MITDEEEEENDEAARRGREETTVVGRPIIRLHQRIIHHDRGEGLRLLRLYAFCSCMFVPIRRAQEIWLVQYFLF